MYLAFYKFNRKPFANVTDPEFFYQTESVREIYEQIQIATQNQEPNIWLTGKPGTGKTVLLRHMMANPVFKVGWIFIDLAKDFSDETACSDDFFPSIKEKITGQGSKDKYSTIILDEVNLLTNDTLQKLLQWQNRKQKKGRTFTIIFTGIRGVTHTPFHKDLVISSTDLNLCYNLEAFNYQETCALIAFRLKLAGHTGPAIFETDTLKLIYQLSDGVPDIIDQICDLALFLTAYHGQQQAVTRQFVDKAFNYLFVNKNTGPIEELPRGFPPIEPAPTSFESTPAPIQPAPTRIQLVPARINPAPPLPATIRPHWQTSIKKPVMAGLLALLIVSGTWMLTRDKSERTSENILPPLTAETSSNDVIEKTKEMFFVDTDDLSPTDSETEVNTPTEDDIRVAYDPEVLVAQNYQPLPGVQEPLPDVQPYTSLRDPVLSEDEEAPPLSTPPINEMEPPHHTEITTIPDSVVPDEGPYLTNLKSTGSSHDPTAQLPTGMVEEAPSINIHALTQQATVALSSNELQTTPEVSGLATDAANRLDQPAVANMSDNPSTSNVQDNIYLSSTGASTPPAPPIPTKKSEATPTAQTPGQAVRQTTAPPEEKLQPAQAVSTPTRKELSPVPAKSPKSDSPVKVAEATAKPKALRPVATTQNKKKDVRTINRPKGAELVAAVESRNYEKLQQLLEKGARVDSVNASGETAVMKAAWVGNDDILTLLLDHKSGINKQNPEGWSALFYGAVKGHRSIVATLLARGAKPNLADLDGRTPLMAATWNGHVEIAKLLLESKAKPNRKNRDGWTALMFAALKGYTDVAHVLLLHGANPSIKNSEGNTCAELAAIEGHTQFASLVTSQN